MSGILFFVHGKLESNYALLFAMFKLIVKKDAAFSALQDFLVILAWQLLCIVTFLNFPLTNYCRPCNKRRKKIEERSRCLREYPRDNQKHYQFLNVLKFRNEWEKSNSFTIEFLNILTLGFLDLDAYHNCIIYLFLFFLPPIADIFDSVKLTFAMCFFFICYNWRYEDGCSKFKGLAFWAFKREKTSRFHQIGNVSTLYWYSIGNIW